MSSSSSSDDSKVHLEHQRSENEEGKGKGVLDLSSWHEHSHVNDLPEEILALVMSYLHPVDVAVCGQVCLFWYHVSRDQSLWQDRVEETFNSTVYPIARTMVEEQLEELVEESSRDSVSSSTSSVGSVSADELQRLWLSQLCESKYDGDWMNLYMNMPRPRTGGVYVSQLSYMRRGYQEGKLVHPMHEVEYCRYFRFFENGTVYMLTTSCVSKKAFDMLSPRRARRKDSKVRIGVYRVAADKRQVFLKFDSERMRLTDLITFDIHDAKKRRLVNGKLGWHAHSQENTRTWERTSLDMSHLGFGKSKYVRFYPVEGFR